MRTWDLRLHRQSRPSTGCADSGVHAVVTAVLNGTPTALIGGDDGKLRVWDLPRNLVSGTAMGHSGPVTALAFTAWPETGPPMAVSGNADGELCVWDVATGRRLGHAATAHAGTIAAVGTTRFHGHPCAVTGGADSTVAIWTLPTLNLLTTLTFPGPISALAVDARNALFVAMGSDVAMYSSLARPGGGTLFR